MATRTVALDGEAYELLRRSKKSAESFSEVVKRLARALESVSQLEVLDVTEPLAVDAARLGGECARRGSSVGSLDLIVAAVAKHHRATILTKDSDFSRIPGIAVETY
ncbi:MAG: type II toxin-antitoxin system VapC family toxin [Thermoplasmata archaeon]|nr:type II toxin-antitoxin system VapC family toxin [Thermoplasmata archaeon]